MGYLIDWMKKKYNFVNFRFYKAKWSIGKIFTRFILSSVTFDIANFILSAVASGGIFYFASDEKYYSNWFKDKNVFLIMSFLAILLLAVIVFYFKKQLMQRRQRAFRQVNEVMNDSFNLLLTYFSEKMALIQEASSKDKIIGYLKQISEERLFANLATSLNSCVAKLFSSDDVEVKIDIFKQDGTELKPLLDTMVNGIFIEGKKSKSFNIGEEVIEYNSLAEYTYSHTRVGYITDIPKVMELLKCLDVSTQKKFRNRYHLYYEYHDKTEAFQPGTIITFPLHHGETRYGVLSIAFSNSYLYSRLRILGLSEMDFIKNFSSFMARYTEFVIATSNGIDKIEYHLEKKKE